MKLADTIGRHFRLFLKSYASSVGIVTAVSFGMLAIGAIFSALQEGQETLPVSGFVVVPLAVVCFLVVVTPMLLPVAIVGHVIALLVAKRLRNPVRVACVGAVLGPLIGVPVMFLPFVSRTSNFRQAFDPSGFLAFGVPAIVAGAAIGWIVARDYRQRSIERAEAQDDATPSRTAS